MKGNIFLIGEQKRNDVWEKIPDVSFLKVKRHPILLSLFGENIENNFWKYLDKFIDIRGLPDDISKEVLSHAMYARDKNSEIKFSYVTLNDVAGFNWDKSIKIHGYISEKEYILWDKKSPIKLISSPSSKKILMSIKEYENSWKKEGLNQLGYNVYIKVHYKITYRESVKGFFNKAFPILVKAVAKQDVSRARFIYWIV